MGELLHIHQGTQNRGRLSARLDRIASATRDHARRLLDHAPEELDRAELRFVPSLQRTGRRHLEAAERLRSLSGRVATHGLDPATSHAVAQVLAAIRAHHERERDVAWLSVAEDLGDCD
ncbi:MAG: hypothetical protein ACOCV4_08640 [Myxococcota bacterium]